MKNIAKLLALLTLAAPACGEIPGSDPVDPPHIEVCDSHAVFFVKKCLSGTAICRSTATAVAPSVPVTGCAVVLASADTGATYTAECVESCDE